MKSKIVLTKNVAALNDAGEALLRRSPGMPGMGLVHGETGYGKTTAITWIANRCNAVYVRALAAWTPASMFRAILRELGRDSRGSCADMMEAIVEALAMSGRPLYLDEADYIVDSKRMTESLRDIHDMSTSPVTLVGMGGIDQRLSHRKQLTGRVMQDVKFAPLDLEDAGRIASELSEIELAPDLLEHLHRESAGSTRLVCVGLARIEQSARSRGLGKINLQEWGKRPLFTGEAPQQGAQQGLRAVR
ncbi:ATP-binding protein [Algiphilus sp.]|uniref:AAA family ATPase n=1 Tax=Algiphilus sp. TaxID=1872431 RepID=UPI0025BAE968|nr:ATP-binding protein [Algiphilus sp.]MCK5772028.1 ATP-binding protein [Algiphilus sp.]